MPVTDSNVVLQSRLRELWDRHAKIEGELADEFAAPAPDAFHISLLKKRKMMVRDEIAEIERQLYPDIIA